MNRIKGFLLCITTIIMAICCEKKTTRFDKTRYLESCGLSLEDMLISDSQEDSLLTLSKGIDSILLLKRHNFIERNDIYSCYELLLRLANQHSYSSSRNVDSLLLNHYYAKGLSVSEEAKDIVRLTLCYAKILPYQQRKRVGEVSFKFANRINDTLAAQSVFRIVEGIVAYEYSSSVGISASEYNSVSYKDAKEVLKWSKIGQEYAASAFKDDEANYRFLLEKLAYYSWKIKDPEWQLYTDLLFAYKSKTDTLLKGSFDGPIYDSFLNALKSGNYEKAESIVNYYSYTTPYPDSLYTQLKHYLPERPRRDYSQADSITLSSGKKIAFPSRDAIWLFITTFFKFNGAPDLETVTCVEKARLCFLKGDKEYSKWLNRAFYHGVTRIFPTTAYEFIDNYLRPGHTYNQGMIDLLTRQYNNDDPRSVYDAILFLKGASEIIPASIYNDIKQYSPREIIDYVDSIRVYDIDNRYGFERDYLENEIGVHVKSVLQNCIASFSDIQHLLKSGDIAVEFYAAPSLGLSNAFSYRAAVLSSDFNEPVIVDLCTERVLKDLLLSDELYSVDKAYRLIVRPIEKYLLGKRVVYFSMDRLLNLCNLPALLTPRGTRLGQEFFFKQLTSSRELLSQSDSIKCESIALFGGIDYSHKENDRVLSTVVSTSQKSLFRSFNRDDFSPLPYSKLEIDDISRQATSIGLNVQYYNAGNGTERALKALSGQSISILHIATHGFYYSQNQTEEIGYLNMLTNDDNPLNRCGLLLAGSKNTWRNGKASSLDEDGILFGEEIARLDFSEVDLVVLSVCKSALGDINSEGVTGLRQAFKRAGAKSILITLSNVDDKATAFFMKAFYAKLFITRDKYEAFDYAINQMKSSEEFSSTSYWAPFILID